MESPGGNLQAVRTAAKTDDPKGDGDHYELLSYQR
jgi:hypothetical protein